MNFTVLWPDRVLQAVARSYLAARAAGLTEAMTRAMAAADRVLASHPTSAGESRGGTERILIERPLVFEYEVFAEERTVVVVEVRLLTS